MARKCDLQAWFMLLLYAVGIFQVTVGSLRWLALDRLPLNSIWSEKSVCSQTNGLSGRQAAFCQKYFQWMKPVHDASHETKDECLEQFKNRKWNCMSVNKAPNYDSDLLQDTKEAGFLYALSSATLALKFSSSCLSGTISNCNCGEGPRQLSLPSDVVDDRNLSHVDARLACKGIMRVGREFSSKFITMGLRRQPKSEEYAQQVAVRQHNTQVGLKMLEKGEEISCVCNGATAGCVVKYCYRRLAQLQEVSEKLLQKYDQAEKAEFRLELKSIESPNNKVVRNHLSSLHANGETIVYLSEGEEYCNQQQTSRRPCVLDESKPNSCKNLCCGRGFKETVVDITSQCECKFVFCCKVECQTCQQKRTIYECK